MFHCLKSEGPKNESRKNEDPKNEGRKNEERKNEGRKNDGRKTEGPKHEGPKKRRSPKNEGRKNECPKNEGPKNRRPKKRRSKKRRFPAAPSRTPPAPLSSPVEPADPTSDGVCGNMTPNGIATIPSRPPKFRCLLLRIERNYSALRRRPTENRTRGRQHSPFRAPGARRAVRAAPALRRPRNTHTHAVLKSFFGIFWSCRARVLFTHPFASHIFVSPSPDAYASESRTRFRAPNSYDNMPPPISAATDVTTKRNAIQ